MFQRPILRNEEGASPGGGAAQPPAPQPAPAPAQGSVPAAIDPAQLAGAIAPLVRDAVFAELRRSGQLKPPAAPPPPSPPPAAAAAPPSAPPSSDPPPPPGMTPQQIQDLMARERAFTRAAAAAGLSAEQEALVEQAFRAVNPPDPSAWVSTFVRGLGIGTQPPAAAPAPQAPTAPPAPAAPPSGPSFSDKGPAAATAARDPLAIIQNDPRKATMDDYRRLVAQHGEEKAMRMWADHAMAFWATAKVRPDGRR